MTRRLARLTPAELTDEQREVYNAIAGGDRAKHTQHFPMTAPDGSLNGPFGPMLHSPRIGAALAELGSRLRFHTNVSARCREVAILQVAQHTGSTFEWWAHTRVAKAVGITDDELLALSIGAHLPEDPVERAVAELCANLLASSAMTDEEHARAAAVLTVEQIFDVTVLVGYYRTLAQLMTVFDVGIPDGEPPAEHGPSHHHPH